MALRTSCPNPLHGERHALALDQPVVEAGRPRRRHLAIEVDVRPRFTA
jgi:hypothetical protein